MSFDDLKQKLESGDLQLPAIETVKDYLEFHSKSSEAFGQRPLHGWSGGYHGWLFKHGMQFKWKPKPRRVPKGQLRECFKNAFDLAVSKPNKYIYCEGFAAGFIPTIHAWCIDAKTFVVVDNTWSSDLTEDETVKNPRDYFGVPFDLGFVTETIFDRDVYGVIDNYQRGWPLLTMEVGEFWDERIPQQ